MIREAVDLTWSLCQSWTTSYVQAIIGLTIFVQICAYIRNYIVTISSSGLTPPRTDYEYVRTIHKPLVHQQLLETFRLEKLDEDEDAAANMALPLTDSEDEFDEITASSGDDKESIFADVSIECIDCQ